MRRALKRSGKFFAPVGAALTARDAFGLAGRVYRNAKNKRKWSKYKEAPNKRPRSAGPLPAGPVPKTPSARVPAKYAVATSMKKFKKQKLATTKCPKSAIVHYKDFGQFKTEKCMWINHEHWGHVDKFWKGIGYGLTKMLLPKAKIFPAKSLEDPCIGPRTKFDDILKQYDNKSSAVILRLIYTTEAPGGQLTYSNEDINVEDVSPSPDVYRSFDAIASAVGASLKGKYNQDTANRTWLQSAQYLLPAGSGNDDLTATPIFVQNLDDAEVHLYVNTLIKFQNVTTSDAGSLDKQSIDANPLQGRMYTAKHHKPIIDSDLLISGDKTLDNFFGDLSSNGSVSATPGFHLLGSGSNSAVVTDNDIGRIQHIPPAKELYGNQSVKAGIIHMLPGAMKYHKTSFTMKKTFRELAKVNIANASNESSHSAFGSHTLFAFALAHKHGEDTISIGWNRDADVGCYVKHKLTVHPIKTNLTNDAGLIEITAAALNPADYN